jgi:dTDP-4-dehydrorhamnose 3,5-epimerase
MRFLETPLAGLYLLELDVRRDERGSFARTYDHDAFVARGLDPLIRQCSTSFNARAGTLRGLHYQDPPYEETKLVRVTRGAVFDVAVDLRPDSPTHGRWFATELTADNGRQLFIPRGFAHGFQTLVDGAEIVYHMGADYSAEHARGARWDDPAFAIDWPEPPGNKRIMSERDASYPDYARRP